MRCAGPGDKCRLFFLCHREQAATPDPQNKCVRHRHLINRSRKKQRGRGENFSRVTCKRISGCKSVGRGAHIAYNSHLTDDLRQEYCLWPTQSYFLMRGVSPEQQLNERTITAMFQFYCCTARVHLVCFLPICAACVRLRHAP